MVKKPEPKLFDDPDEDEFAWECPHRWVIVAQRKIPRLAHIYRCYFCSATKIIEHDDEGNPIVRLEK